jgi:hypothetical protein
MLRNLHKSIATMTFLALTSLPATAQVGVRVDVPLPSLEVHVGHTAPPRPRSERRPERPGRDFVWISGSWHLQDRDWVWIPGRWERPVEPGAHWVRARYEREGSAWRYEPGHWSSQRVIEGEDYRRWREEHHTDRDHDRDRDRDHDRDRDQR